MKIDSILIPHDGSRLSGAAASALEPLIASGTTVTLLHVYRDHVRDEVLLLETTRQLEQRGATVVRKNVESFDPASAILDLAEELRPDLVAMTTHGRSGIERWVRGSVAEHVMRESPVPLFMINPFTHRTTEISSIVVPLDSSEHSAHVLQPLIPFARELGARITLLFVDWDDPTDSPKARAARRDERAELISGWLAEPRAKAEAAGLGVELEIVHGDVVEEILRQTDSDRHSLLAMSTHGRSGPGRWLLGSITEKVLRECRTPMFVARSAQ